MEIAKTKAPSSAADWIAIGIASAGGAGFMPKAPGTAGAVVGVSMYLVLEGLNAGAYYLHVIILLLFAGTWASWRVEEMYGHDSQRIVIDEVVGQLITFVSVAGKLRLPALDVVIGFGLFRLFDIVKPFPIRRLERLKGGIGIMADDLGAGVYALVVLVFWRSIFRG